MTVQSLLIFLENLKNGDIQKFEMSISPQFLEVNEPDLLFDHVVQVSGEAYLADVNLIFCFEASTIGKMPCAICNQMIPFSLKVQDYYHTEELVKIKNGQFDGSEIIRAALLIELPKKIECLGGCLERANLAPYLHDKLNQKPDQIHFPFTNL